MGHLAVFRTKQERCLAAIFAVITVSFIISASTPLGFYGSLLLNFCTIGAVFWVVRGFFAGLRRGRRSA